MSFAIATSFSLGETLKMSANTSSEYQRLANHLRETGLLASANGLLGWDQQTYLPSGGNNLRAEQMAYLSGLIHRRQTDPQLGQWLDTLCDSDLAADPHSPSGATLRCLRRDYERNCKLPQQLVETLASLSVTGQQAWIEARQQNNFAHFAPLLEQTIRLKREQAEALGFVGHLYDPLLDEYEPGQQTAQVAQVLADLREALVPLIQQIEASPVCPSTEILRRRYPEAGQARLGRAAAEAIGFDFQRGRLDVAEHPFCGGCGADDTRITTRYDEHYFNSAFFGTLHEAGHGLYEQGLPSEALGLPTGEAVSLGIHESQSRMWENLVGRSRSFWEFWYPRAQTEFPEALQAVDLDTFYFAVNDVRPSLIRVEADEATYNLHILIRFELEQALVGGELQVADLPEAWNAKYEKYLGIRPSSDADGVLQDVHWSAGLFGYFPTYSLGNLYASQMFEAATEALGDLDTMFCQGNFAPLRDWLRREVHRWGRCYSASELIERITGKPLSHEPLMQHLRGKFAVLYGLSTS